MKKEFEYSDEYPQRIYDYLTNTKFRELLSLEVREADGDFDDFKNQIKSYPEPMCEYSELLYEVGVKECELQGNLLKF